MLISSLIIFPPLCVCVFVSGDADSVVPVTSTRYSLDALKLPIVVPWYAWYHHEQVINPLTPLLIYITQIMQILVEE